MAILRPFCAIMPKPEFASQVAAPPYDVLNTAEAKAYVQDKPHSFLYVDKPEIGMADGTDPFSPQAYQQAKAVLQQLFDQGIYHTQQTPGYFIYCLTFEGKTQRGIVGCASIDAYLDGSIKKHEDTVADQEVDRIKHVDTLNANTGPIFLAYNGTQTIANIIDTFIQHHTPLYDFVSADGVQNTCYAVQDQATVCAIADAFSTVENLYIADGHHRTASAVKVGLKRREQAKVYTGDEEFNFFLCVAFAGQELKIMDYNRVVADLNGMSQQQFLQALRVHFEVVQQGELWDYHPQNKGQIALYLDSKWYLLTAKDTHEITDLVEQLDVSLLQRFVLDDLLNIKDPKTDKRVAFVGGIRGLGELQQLVDSGKYKAAFAMYPTSIDELFAVADSGRNMPPKSTWFEPKLKSGLFIHDLSD